MRTRWPYIALSAAIFLGLITTFLAYRWMDSQAQAKLSPQQESFVVQPVVVAALDLSPGSVIRRNSVKVVKWPKNTGLESLISDPEYLVDRVIIAPMLSGEPFTENKLAPEGAEGGLTAMITPG